MYSHIIQKSWYNIISIIITIINFANSYFAISFEFSLFDLFIHVFLLKLITNVSSWTRDYSSVVPLKLEGLISAELLYYRSSWYKSRSATVSWHRRLSVSNYPEYISYLMSCGNGSKCRRQSAARLFRYLFAIGPRYSHNKWGVCLFCVPAYACTCVCAMWKKHRDI